MVEEVNVESVGVLSKLIHDYGPFVVILSVFLLIFLVVNVYMLQQNKKSVESDREMNSQLVTSLLNDYFAKNSHILEMNQKSYDERNIVSIYMELNKTLKNACEDIMRKTNSDRTAIYVFHNGSSASHGLPFFKMSCICEVISMYSNANIKLAEHSAIPLNLFDSIVSGLYNNSKYRILIDQSKDPSELIFLKGTKIKDCFFNPIYDDDNNMMGFIFNGHNTIDENRTFETEQKYLIELAKMARPVIEFSKVQEYSNKKEGTN